MVRGSKTLFFFLRVHHHQYHHLRSSSSSSSREAIDSGRLLNNTLTEVLVCPLSKSPLRFNTSQEESPNHLISDALGVSYPVVDGIPCLVPRDGKLLETNEAEATNSLV